MSPFDSRIILPVLFLLLLLAVPGYGQDSVTVVSGAAYARYGTKLYVVGGGYSREVKPSYPTFNTVSQFVPNEQGQFMVLDLSVPWDAATPAWKRLANGPIQGVFPAAMSGDGHTLATFHSNRNSTDSGKFAWLYNVTSDIWSISTIRVPRPDRDGRFAVTDPTTNLAYLPGGYESDESAQMLVYNFTSDTAVSSPLPAGRLVNVTQYKGLWWAQKKSILYFGGYLADNSLAPAGITQFTPSSSTWTTLVTKGNGPSSRADFCMEISDDGTKLVIYGGRVNEQWKTVFKSELFILDLETLTWTLAKDNSQPRVYSVCTIVNSTFISWGGQDSIETVSQPAVLYNLKTNKYLTKFMSPDASVDDVSNTDGSGNGTGGNFKLSTGAIVGIVIGSLAFLCLCYFCVFRRCRKGQVYIVEHPVDQLSTSTQKIENSTSETTLRPTVVRPLPQVPPATPHGYRPYPPMNLQPTHIQKQFVYPVMSARSQPHSPQAIHSYPPLQHQPNVSMGLQIYPSQVSNPLAPHTISNYPPLPLQQSSIDRNSQPAGAPTEAPPGYYASFTGPSTSRAPQVVPELWDDRRVVEE
ncbi:hypothetical protein BGX28_009285 [Mortierella sp. GBA30]|nr:hypothetical protein BGX28_009285 [Mortierella sp. GBA30]